MRQLGEATKFEGRYVSKVGATLLLLTIVDLSDGESEARPVGTSNTLDRVETDLPLGIDW